MTHMQHPTSFSKCGSSVQLNMRPRSEPKDWFYRPEEIGLKFLQFGVGTKYYLNPNKM